MELSFCIPSFLSQTHSPLCSCFVLNLYSYSPLPFTKHPSYSTYLRLVLPLSVSNQLLRSLIYIVLEVCRSLSLSKSFLLPSAEDFPSIVAWCCTLAASEIRRISISYFLLVTGFLYALVSILVLSLFIYGQSGLYLP